MALLNVLDCWMRWECDIRLYYWICWHCWICGTVEWDMNEKLDNTTEFVILLNIWNCWMRYECEIRLYYWICDTVEYVGLLNEILVWKWIYKRICENVECVRLLNEMRLWYQIIQLNLLTLLNKCDFWKRWECKTR